MAEQGGERRRRGGPSTFFADGQKALEHFAALRDLFIFDRMDKDRAVWPLFFWITAACLFVYLALRAWYVPPVHDEAATFFIYVQTGNFLPWEAFWDANNHLLNSALSSLFYRLLGDHIFVLRLGSLLFFPVYAWYIYRLSLFFFRRHEQWLFGLSLLFLHNYMEYFGYCRGYGMGLACCMALVYHLVAYTRDQRTRDLCFFSLFVPLALMSNLNLLLVALIGVGYISMNLLLHRKRSLVFFLLWNGAWLGLAIWYGAALQSSGALYYGGEKGLLPDTVTSLSTLLFDSKNSTGMYLVLLPAVVSLLLLPFIFAKKKFCQFFTEPVWALQLVFWGCIVAIPLMHLVLGTKYPEDRTVMHLVLLSLVLFFVTLKTVFDQALLRSLVYGACSLGLVILFLLSTNLQYTTFWKSESIPYSFFERTQKGIKGHETYVSGYRLHALIWAYYNYRSGDFTNPLHTGHYLEEQSDYMIASDSAYYRHALCQWYKIAAYNRSTGNMLLERREKTRLQAIDTLFVPDQEKSTEMYVNLLQYRDTSIADPDLCFEISGRIKTGPKPVLEMILKSSERGAPPEEYDGIGINLNWLSDKKPVDGYDFRQRMYSPNMKKKPRDLVLFMFNPNQQPYSFSHLKVVVYRIVYP